MNDMGHPITTPIFTFRWSIDQYFFSNQCRNRASANFPAPCSMTSLCVSESNSISSAYVCTWWRATIFPLYSLSFQLCRSLRNGSISPLVRRHFWQKLNDHCSGVTLYHMWWINKQKHHDVLHDDSLTVILADFIQGACNLHTSKRRLTVKDECTSL